MQVTPDLMHEIAQAIEAIDYGTVTIKINEGGKYTEISSELKKRVLKEEANGIIRGVEKRYVREQLLAP
jgi:hypothetical protein